MTHEEIMAGALKLTSAFIANGDIRLAGNTRHDSQAVLMIVDLITTHYAVVSSLDAQFRDEPPPPPQLKTV